MYLSETQLRLVEEVMKGNSEAEIDVKGVSKLMIGLQHMTCDNAHVRGIVGSVASILSRSDMMLDGQSIGNILYGMKSLNSGYLEVIDLIRVLTVKIEASKAVLNAQAIGNAV